MQEFTRFNAQNKRIASICAKTASCRQKWSIKIPLLAIAVSCILPPSLDFQPAQAYTKELEASIIDNLSAELGFPLYTWAPEKAPQAVIIAIHGATLHGRSYTKLAEHLVKKGYAVFSPDLRGFGAWYHDSKEDDELARHVLYRQSETDLRNLLSKVHQLYPGKPVFLMGESVGANMAIRLLASAPDCADGMILSSPAIKQRYFFGPSVIFQALKVFFVNPAAQLDVTPYLRSRVSENDKIVDERVNDPLARNKLNVGELWKTRWFNKDCLKMLPQLPANASVLVLEGSEDKLFRADEISELMEQLPCHDKTLHLMKGKGHIHLETVHIEKSTETVVYDWLAQKCNKFANKDHSEETPSVSSKNTAIIP